MCWRSKIVAESASRDYGEDELFDLVRRAWPYRALERADFDAVLQMTADGFATKRGRRGALVHRDEVNRSLRGRRGARLVAQTSGGAIPEIADYRVVLEPDDTFIGTLNEDFAIESMAGDVFQLGNASWRVLAGCCWHRPGRRRQGRAAEHSLLVWRSAGAERRAVARRQRPASRS